jgi:hypothetical protein
MENEINTAKEAVSTAGTIQLNIERSMVRACDSQKEDIEVLLGEVRDSFAHYCRKRPMIASSLVFLAGFYVGWKIKPW